MTQYAEIVWEVKLVKRHLPLWDILLEIWNGGSKSISHFLNVKNVG